MTPTATTQSARITRRNEIQPDNQFRLHNNPLQGSLYTFHGLKVHDAGGRSVGIVDWIWSDDSGIQGEFVGVQLRWLRGKARAIPVGHSMLNPETSTLQVPYFVDQIKRAPRVAINRAPTAEEKRAIHFHYSATPALLPQRATPSRVTA